MELSIKDGTGSDVEVAAAAATKTHVVHRLILMAGSANCTWVVKGGATTLATLYLLAGRIADLSNLDLRCAQNTALTVSSTSGGSPAVSTTWVYYSTIKATNH